MAAYRIAMDVVGMSKILELLDNKRRCEDIAARFAILKEVVENENRGNSEKMLKAIQVFEKYGIRTKDAIFLLNDLTDALKEDK